MGLTRKEYWSGLPCPPPGDLPNPGIEPVSLDWQVGSLPPGKPQVMSVPIGNVRVTLVVGSGIMRSCRWVFRGLEPEEMSEGQKNFPKHF